MVYKKINIDLLNRINVSYRDDQEIKCIKLNDFKDLLIGNSINGETIIFNNLVKTKTEYLNNWETNVENSWLSQFVD